MAEPLKTIQAPLKQLMTVSLYPPLTTSGKSSKVSLQDTGVIPCNRAAHATCTVEINEILMYGGALVGGTIAKEQLYNLRVEGGTAVWNELQVTGPKPSPRYGHTLTFSKPFVILFGGSTGNETLNETWCLDIHKTQFSWVKLNCTGNIPTPRVYHSADLCQYGGAAGMIIIFGGRDSSGKTLNDIWGLRRHRDGRWDWTKPPDKKELVAPLGRYQHRSIFFGSLMFNIGGKINESICNNLFSVYDYEYNKWYTADGPQCFRHVCWILSGRLHIHGGLDNKNKILAKGEIMDFDVIEIFKDYPDLTKKIKNFVDIFTNHVSPLSSRSNSPGPAPHASPHMHRQSIHKVSRKELNDGENISSKGKAKKPTIKVSLPKKNNEEKTNKPEICNYFIQNLLRPKTYTNLPPDAEFIFRNDEIVDLVEQCEEVVKNQPILVRTESPTTIFGDIHGQYSDLMRFFDLWGAPCNPEEEGGIDMEDDYSYVFLGDYVDRGNHSLETMCLLLALKVKFPHKIFLLRGNHEDRWINQSFGFYDECELRLGENPDLPDSCFNKINNLFEYLPLACIIDNTILCIHGGIGSSLKKVEQIETIERPLEVVHEVSTALEKLVVDILWSDPTDHDGEFGIQPNHVRDPHGTGNIVKFGPDVVKEFLQRNKLSKIIRAHECVMDGFERFAGGDLFTIFSATDYCGKHKNAGAILTITKSYGISPKLIYPNMQTVNWIDEDESGYRPPTPPRWHGNPQANY